MRRHYLIGAMIVAAIATGAAGQELEQPPSGWVLAVAPTSHLYPLYTADPRRATSSAAVLRMASSDLPESGDLWFALRLGGRFRLLKLHPASDPTRGVQLDFEAGFLGLFDIDHSLDNLGWDGFYGLLATWRPHDRWALRAGMLHDSAHVGDEFVQRTGRERLGYTREEWVLGAAYTPSAQWLFYLEGARAFTERLAGQQRPGRLQAGAEHRWEMPSRPGRAGWYTALDLAATEERDWRVTATAQLGVELATGWGAGRYRLALEAQRGRSPLGEFFASDQTHLGVGLWFDL